MMINFISLSQSISNPHQIEHNLNEKSIQRNIIDAHDNKGKWWVGGGVPPPH
jgi:hypothetical protein